MKPMLASPPDPKHPIRFPVLASPKIDGVRAIIHNGVALSRSLKPIRNEYVQSVLSLPELQGLDGELVVGDPNDPNCMQNTTSGVMRIEGTPDFVFHVFDMWDQPALKYTERANRARRICHMLGDSSVRFLEGFEMADQAALDEYEARCLADGYEGVMIRDPWSFYKFGRATAKSQELLKIKRFVDDEAVIIGVEELYHNDNEAKTNELGRTQRSTAKAGLRAAGTLGKLIGRMSDGRIVQPGTGYTAKDRDDLWAAWHAGTLEGKLFTFKHFEQVGVKEAPRFPVFKALRDARDLS
jgi:DNA ligase-1